jgi:hypothetical protein
MSKVTLVPYEYTDARGFSASGKIYVAGTFTPGQIAAIDESLDSGEFFIPTQVGLRTLQQDLITFPCADDHVWHILETSDFAILEALPEGKGITCTAHEFANRFDNIEWNVAQESLRLGLD